MIPTLIARAPLICILLLFPVLAMLVLGRLRSRAPGPVDVAMFALLNLGLSFGIVLATAWHDIYPKREAIYFTAPATYFLVYIALTLVHLLLVRSAAKRATQAAWMTALFYPVLMLIVIRYVLVYWDPFLPFLSQFSKATSVGLFVGISYITFRAIRMTVEVRNAVVPVPTLAEYLGFMFFCPTLTIGPITTYSLFRKSLYAPDRAVTPYGNAVLRILKGLAKYLFLASLLSQLTYSGLMLDGHPHGWLDLAVSVCAYYLFLYCNFSGFSDIVIGASGLVGLQVDENFRNPLGSRNLQEFWSRWHMSLSYFMRDLVFQPMTKWFMRRWGPKRLNEAMVVPTITIFVLIGVWHGLQWNYILFGLAHGIGVVFVVYLAHFMRTRMGVQRYRAYMANPLARGAAITMTFCYVAATHFLFANTLPQMQTVLGTVQ
ncbi:MAG TPA: MBOAT family O-acyltransferase [Steroidobacteraceae bacterium]|nr:MBOAT family O-acyltransferase [Steroidobacteraceae bacterium]